MWTALRRWRRERVLRKVHLEERLWQGAVARFPYARALAESDQRRLRECVQLFLHEKQFSTAHGLVLTDAMRLSVAIQACVPILNLDLDYYRGWSGIVLYPEGFVPRHQYTDELGVVHQGDEPYAGEAWLGGPVILSWADVQEGEHHPEGVNVVIHEFAHKLDMLNGGANGYPPLHRKMNRQDWSQAFNTAFQDFSRRVDRGEDTLIDPYASESPAEFFAVVSEAFFELPDVVQDEYPEVYAQLARFYRQDPRLVLQRDSEPAPA